MNVDDEQILGLLRKGDERGMQIIFSQYYNYMCHAVVRIVDSPDKVEDIVQEVLMDFWKKREKLNVTTSLKAYLRRSCVNKALNSIRDQKIKLGGELSEEDNTLVQDADNSIVYDELKKVIENTIENLPNKCKLVFILSRYEQMSYKEISQKLDISVKTVENQISKALKILRKNVTIYNNM